MSGVNKVILIGRVGNEPDIKVIGEKKVANFSFATSETYKDKNSGDKIENTEWHRITIWGSLADVVENYTKKGSKLYLEGKNMTRSYEKDVHTFYVTEVICDQLIMLDKKED